MQKITHLSSRFVLASALAAVFAVVGLAAVTHAAQPADISADPNTSGATATHSATATVGPDAGGSSFTGLQVDYSVAPAASDVSGVGQEDLETLTVNGTDVTGDVSDVSSSNEGETLDITLGGNNSLAAGDTIAVEYTGAVNAASDDDVSIVINPQSAADDATVTLAIDDGDDGETATTSQASVSGGGRLAPRNASNADTDDEEDEDPQEEPESDPVTINVMKHICGEGVQSVADFNELDVDGDGTTEFTDKVLACPTVLREGDSYDENAVHFDENRNFNFQVVGQDGDDQEITDATLVNQKVCESSAPDNPEENTVYLGADVNGDGEMNACLDTSHYRYSEVAGGDNVSVTELQSPTSQRGGALEFTPAPLNGGFDEEQTLGDDEDRFEGGVVELDTAEDNDGVITLHLYNFQDSQEEAEAPGGETLQALLDTARQRLMNLAEVLGAQTEATVPTSFPNTGGR